jgi:hypothetical protein
VKRIISILVIAILGAAIFSTGAGARGAAAPSAVFTLVSGLPATMQVGDSATVTVLVTSPDRFTSAQALADDQFPGRGVVSHGAAHARAGTSATLSLVFTARGSTTDLPGGADQVALVAGVRYPNGQTVSQRFDFTVVVP